MEIARHIKVQASSRKITLQNFLEAGFIQLRVSQL